MIVQCPECTTKYNLDESKIGRDGTKVRCTRCKNVFSVFRPMPVTEETGIAAPASRPAAAQPAAPPEPQAAPRSTIDDLEDDLAALLGDTPKAPRPAPAPPAASPEARPAPRMTIDDLEDDLASVLGDAPKASRPAAKSESPARAAESSPVDEDMLADLQGAFQQPLIPKAGRDPLMDEEPAAPSKKSGRLGLILGLLLFLVAAAGAGVYFLQPSLLGLGGSPASHTATPEAPAVKEGVAQIALENVRQYFVPNEKEGQLFIIEGKAVNRFPEAREMIRLKASLFDKQSQEVAAQEFMCGNVVSLYQLQVSSKADIEAALTAKVGILTNNSNIQPGASVPFMAVFFKTPESVEEFGLEVLQSTVPQQ